MLYTTYVFRSLLNKKCEWHFWRAQSFRISISELRTCFKRWVDLHNTPHSLNKHSKSPFLLEFNFSLELNFLIFSGVKEGRRSRVESRNFYDFCYYNYLCGTEFCQNMKFLALIFFYSDNKSCLMYR